MYEKLTEKINDKRICLKLDFKRETYPKYLFRVLLECGFDYNSSHKEIVFTHIQNTDLSVVVSCDLHQNWHHLISYRHSKWTLTYEGDIEYHVFGNKVLETIRKAYEHWHGL